MRHRSADCNAVFRPTWRGDRGEDYDTGIDLAKDVAQANGANEGGEGGAKENRSSEIKLGSRFAGRWRPPFSANHHSLEPETPAGRKALALRIVKLECTFLDVDDGCIAFGPDRKRTE